MTPTNDEQLSQQDDVTLTPSLYRAPTPAQPDQLTPEETRALLAAMLAPYPSPEEQKADPQAVERHTVLTVRPGESGASYADRRVVSWMRALEKDIAESEPEKVEYRRLALGDLMRMWHLSQVREQGSAKRDPAADQYPSHPAGAGELHMHYHRHSHEAIPDFSQTPSQQLADLARALEKQVHSTASESETKTRTLPAAYRDITNQQEGDA